MTQTAEIPFEIGRIYNRRRDIHDQFGGQRQGGISTPSGCPFVFLFTGKSGEQYGYKDGWANDEVFHLTGEGQVGDMKFIRGNRAIRDHSKNGKELLLFEDLGKGKGVRFLGDFACTSWEPERGPDKLGSQRQILIFHLLQPKGTSEKLGSLEGVALDELRKRAMEASRGISEGSSKLARRLYYERSEAVKAYVLARAHGTCEACRKPAPFLRPDGTAYLEPHHIRRVSDGGPDDPRWVGATCPNCHREIHCGINGEDLNKRLRLFVTKIEDVGG